MAIEILDCCGDELGQDIREVMMNNVDVFMLCVDASNQNSLTSVPRWLQEIRVRDAYKPIVLALNKK